MNNLNKIQVATILPTPLLGSMPECDYHMCLHHIVQTNQVYTDFYAQLSKEGKFIILDNGQAEGISPSWEELIDSYNKINPSEIVLPDTIGDTVATLTRTKEAYDKYVEMGLHEKYQFMGVAQGENFNDWFHCMSQLLSLEHITTIGVSKFVTKLYQEEMGEDANVRLECVSAILSEAQRQQREVQIHLLGCWDDPSEIGEISKAYPGRVRGTDSAIAYVYSRNNVIIDGIEKRPDQDHIDFHDGDLRGNSMETLHKNIALWQEYCNK